jgi:hypothetical protein
MWKKQFSYVCCAIATGASVCASPLELSKVANGSKWLIHLDFEAFRKTKVGAHVVDDIIQPRIDKSEKAQKLNLSINLQNISSITAYGPAFQKKANGVLVVETTADVKKDLDTLCGMSSLSGGSTLKLDHLKPYPVYSFKDEIFIAPGVQNAVLLAKSKDQLEAARQVLLGKSESMAKSQEFNDYPARGKTFFFIGMAEGFSESPAIPPQAQVLKETRGGRFVLGEKDDKLVANLVFKGKDEESTLKIQQVLQGIVALVSLSQENKEATELARAAKIASEGNTVSVDLLIPLQQAIEHIDEKAAR